MTDPPSLIIEVPSDVYDFIETTKDEDPEIAVSIEQMVKHARKEGLKEVANWIKNNPIAYGVGYWNGFKPTTPTEHKGESPEKPEPDKPKRKRKRRPPKE